MRHQGSHKTNYTFIKLKKKTKATWQRHRCPPGGAMRSHQTSWSLGWSRAVLHHKIKMPRSPRKASRKPPITFPLLEGGLAQGLTKPVGIWSLGMAHLSLTFVASFSMNPALLPSLLIRRCWSSGVQVEQGGVGAPRDAETSQSAGEILWECRPVGRRSLPSGERAVGGSAPPPPGAGKRAEYFLQRIEEQ